MDDVSETGGGFEREVELSLKRWGWEKDRRMERPPGKRVGGIAAVAVKEK